MTDTAIEYEDGIAATLIDSEECYLRQFWLDLRRIQRQLLFAGYRTPGTYADFLRMLDKAALRSIALTQGQPFAVAWIIRHGATMAGTIHFMTGGQADKNLVFQAGSVFLQKADEKFISLMALLPQMLSGSIALAKSLGFKAKAIIPGISGIQNLSVSQKSRRLKNGVFLLRINRNI